MSNCVIRSIRVYHPNCSDSGWLLRLGSDTELKIAQVGDVIEIYDGDRGYAKVHEVPSNSFIIKDYDELGDGSDSAYTDYLRESY